MLYFRIFKHFLTLLALKFLYENNPNNMSEISRTFSLKKLFSFIKKTTIIVLLLNWTRIKLGVSLRNIEVVNYDENKN